LDPECFVLFATKILQVVLTLNVMTVSDGKLGSWKGCNQRRAMIAEQSRRSSRPEAVIKIDFMKKLISDVYTRRHTA
jgi:hypothetical protein